MGPVTPSGDSERPAFGAKPGQGPRRQRRRVVAPPTSGQPEEVEAQVYDPLKPAHESRRGTNPEQVGSQRPSPRDQWFLEERPPHWG